MTVATALPLASAAPPAQPTAPYTGLQTNLKIFKDCVSHQNLLDMSMTHIQIINIDKKITNCIVYL
jgi:hypothetical protein